MRSSSQAVPLVVRLDRKSTRLNSSHANISYAVFCLKKKNTRLNSSHANISYAVFCLKKTRNSVCSTLLSVLSPPLWLVVFSVSLVSVFFFFFNDPAPPEFSPFPLHAPLPFPMTRDPRRNPVPPATSDLDDPLNAFNRS